MKLKLMTDQQFSDKKVLLRADFNVPMADGVITDETRIRAHLDTIDILLESGARTVIVSHLGRPKGRVNEKFSLKPVAGRLSELLGREVVFLAQNTGEEIVQAVEAMNPGDVALMENIRFHPEEEADDIDFARNLAAPFDIFVMDAFSAAHRSHASTAGVAKWLPCCAGKLMEREISFLSEVRDHPRTPFAMLLGGAKVSDKIGVIEHMLDRASVVMIGGAMAFPFLSARGIDVRDSFCEKESIEFAKTTMEKADLRGVDILLPTDIVAAPDPGEKTDIRRVSVTEIPEGFMGLDIGPETIELFAGALEGSKTILWNGPMGMFENGLFSRGTLEAGMAVVAATAKGAVSVLGGGDTAASANILGFADGVTHISTGGGASLEFFEGKTLPGIAPLVED